MPRGACRRLRVSGPQLSGSDSQRCLVQPFASLTVARTSHNRSLPEEKVASCAGDRLWMRACTALAGSGVGRLAGCWWFQGCGAGGEVRAQPALVRQG